VVNASGFAEATNETAVVVSSVLRLHREASSDSRRPERQCGGRGIVNQHAANLHNSHGEQGIVTSQELRDIPLRARSFANIAYMAPGTEAVERQTPQIPESRRRHSAAARA